MGRGITEAVDVSPQRRGNVHRVNDRMVIEMRSPDKLQKAHQLAAQMQELANQRGEEIIIDPALVATINESDPERALDYYLGSRGLILDPEDAAPGMRGAASMLSEVIDRDEKIALFCDYDVDGVTAGEVMRNTLSWYGADPLMGYADMREGFGLDDAFVEKAYNAGCTTIITVDCGSASEDAVLLAKALGMNVIITDHHNATGHDDNEADFHLNPSLHDPPTVSATGAQLAWYLAGALQEEREGSIREEHYGENLYLAGLGCFADFGDTKDPHNRPFLVSDSAPDNLRWMAEQKRQEPEIGNMIATQTLLNLAKRTDAVKGEDIARIFQAQTEEELEEAYRYLVDSKKEQDAIYKKMQTAIDESHSRTAAREDSRIVHHVFDDPRTSGSAGIAAMRLAKAMGTPAFIFSKLKDENGEEIYKFSGRAGNSSQKIGGLKEFPELIEIVGENNIGGHDAAFSGTCRKEDIPRVVEAMERWAKNQENFYPEKSNSSDRVYVDERNVAPERFTAINDGVTLMAPYNGMAGHHTVKTSIKGKIVAVVNKKTWGTATLVLPNGEEHEVSIGRSPERDSDGKIQLLEIEEGVDCEIFFEHRPGQKPIIRHIGP